MLVLVGVGNAKQKIRKKGLSALSPKISRLINLDPSRIQFIGRA